MIEIVRKEECAGCSACMAACPSNCIVMKEDAEGFLYPYVEQTSCIDCGSCEKVCPILNRQEEQPFKQDGYVVQNKEEKILRESTAGGAFSAIAGYVLKRSGVVCGAELWKDLTVRHVCVETKEELARFRGSKYVQSRMENVYREIKAYLTAGRWVCFSGTPCQTEGLKNYLGQEYEKLITVDVVCHAVPSPMVFRKYVKYQEELHHKGIKAVKFRDKYYGYKYSTLNLITADGKEDYHRGAESDPWLRAFLSNIMDRPSCYQCQFKKRYRRSDFTIWDCFSVGRFSKELDNDKGATRVLIHTDKGRALFHEIQKNFQSVQIAADILTKDVKEMTQSVSENPDREAFFADTEKMDGRQLFEKYFPETIRVRAERVIRMFCYRLGIYSTAKKIFVKITGKY